MSFFFRRLNNIAEKRPSPLIPNRIVWAVIEARAARPVPDQIRAIFLQIDVAGLVPYQMSGVNP